MSTPAPAASAGAAFASTPSDSRIAVVTGASSGIGEATARQLAAAGWKVYVGARRKDRLDSLASEIGGVSLALDVSDAASVNAFCEAMPEKVHLLVNNAGGALGLDPVAEAKDEDWETMFATNVLGLMRMTRGLLPNLLAGAGQIVNITSVAAHEVYPGGAGYTAVKHGARAISRTLRIELNGTPVRVTDVAPGMVETEFSEVRFSGDKDKAKKVYDGLTPLTADDIAECVVWAASRPAHVNIDEILVKPVAQAFTWKVARGAGL